jgi:hypothetical protein
MRFGVTVLPVISKGIELFKGDFKVFQQASRCSRRWIGTGFVRDCNNRPLADACLIC